LLLVLTLKKTTTSQKQAGTQTSDIAPVNFEQAFNELETIVAQMESGELALEASLIAYKRGDFLLQFCQRALSDVEQQVQILNERNKLVLFKQDD